MTEQLTFNLSNTPPIKGFPELHWTGKRPYNSTVFFPAQLKESFGEPDENGWMNKIFWGDNLQVMSHLLKEFRGQVDLIYIDPPFDSKADYKKKIEVRGLGKAESDSSSFEEKQYGDIWTNDEYLQFMYERLRLLRELLSDTGSIYVHMDEKRAGYIRVLLDEIFGPGNFRREIIWDITVLSGFKTQAQNWVRGHDVIFYYSKTSSACKFNKLRQPHSQDYIDMFNRVDENGERYLIAHGLTRYLNDVINKGKPYGDVWDDLLSYQVLRKQLTDVRALSQLKEILSSSKEAQNISNVWDNIMSFQQQPTSSENVGYPTQKPESLLERIIKASSNPGDLVFDCFMGSGTTQAVALKLGRRFLGADINLGAVQTTTKRLLGIMKLPGGVQTSQQGELPFDGNGKRLPGLEVYNVNNYDIFRNPVEAKELILKALEVQPVPAGQLWDGELDGRRVKVMPVDHIATKADLEGLIANLPYKTYDETHDKSPNQVVERFIIVCMGHEPDLKDALLKELAKYKVEIDIVDLRRDKKVLQFKREAEAEVVREGNKLVIRSFYPLNLMQKLSRDKASIEDWRQLVDSILIDWNFDGGDTLQPTVLDIPKDKELVKGVYDIPKTAGRIRVKITDLLSESLEVEVQ